MAARLPSVRPREVIRALERAGWEIHRQRGSHVTLKKEGRRLVIVPMHAKDVPRGTLSGIIEDADLTAEEFIALLRGRRA
jgi:predicted RNA binding protein YcfA (HicA-like mRNA interferase family)